MKTAGEGLLATFGGWVNPMLVWFETGFGEKDDGAAEAKKGAGLTVKKVLVSQIWYVVFVKNIY